MITSSANPRSDAQCKELTNLALRGLRLLSSWTAQVMELVGSYMCMCHRCDP